MISDKLMQDMKDAMKGADKKRLGVIRMLRSELKNAEIAAGRKLEPEEEEKILNAYAKKRKEVMATYREKGREDMVEKEAFEYDVTLSYLPPRMGEEALKTIVVKHIDACRPDGMRDFGKVMKAVMAEVGSQADGADVSKIVKQMLSSREEGAGE